MRCSMDLELKPRSRSCRRPITPCCDLASFHAAEAVDWWIAPPIVGVIHQPMKFAPARGSNRAGRPLLDDQRPLHPGRLVAGDLAEERVGAGLQADRGGLRADRTDARPDCSAGTLDR